MDIDQPHSSAILQVDTKGIITLWSKGAEAFFGFSAEYVIGQSMEILIPPSHRERHWKGFNKAMASGKVRHDQLIVNSPILCRDGQIALFPAREILLRDAFGASVGVIAIFSPACTEGEDNGLPTIYTEALNG